MTTLATGDECYPHVFVGPTLDVSEARSICDANYRGPLRRGDLAALKKTACAVVIDGILDDGDRVPLKEARLAIGRGVRLFGAASTGALLAAEVEGMEGVGEVFRYIKMARRPRDELVAAWYQETDYHLLTIPLVNVLLAVENVRPDAVAELEERLRRLPLARRTHQSISAILSACGIESADPLLDFDPKARDAKALLARLSAGHWQLLSAATN